MKSDTEAGRRLHEDHQRTLALIDRLEASLSDGMDETFRHLRTDEDRALLHEFREELAALEAHFAVEEELFPALHAAGADGLTGPLSAQHAEMRPLMRRLDRLGALAQESGFDAETWPVFHAFTLDLIERLVLHLQIEETSLLPLVDEILAPGERTD